MCSQPRAIITADKNKAIIWWDICAAEQNAVRGWSEGREEYRRHERTWDVGSGIAVSYWLIQRWRLA